jgi:hypothetical protein
MKSKHLLTALAVSIFFLTVRVFSAELIETQQNGFSFSVSQTDFIDTVATFNFAGIQESTPKVTLENQVIPVDYFFSGNRRGVPVWKIILPQSILEADTDSFIKVNVEFDKEFLNHPTQKLNYIEKEFFADIINLEQIPSINRVSPAIKKTKSKLQADSWYDHTKDYFEIRTEEEGVASVQVAEMLENMPDWKNKLSSGLIMLHNGKEHYLYLSDSDKRLTDDDKLYFYCSFPHGDTTYYDFYEKRNSYYLYLDESQTGKRLIKLENEAPFGNTLEAVKVNRHIEETYSLSVADNYIMHDEWNSEVFWHRITPIMNLQDSYFSTHQFVLPHPSGEYPLNADLYYRADVDSAYKTPYRFSMVYDVNDERQDTIFKTGRVRTYTRAASDFISGPNKFFMQIFDVENTGSAIINYINIHGYEKPYALAGKTNFEVNDLSQNSTVFIPGLAENTVGIDTLNKTIYFPESKPGTFMTSSAVNSDQGFLSLSINGQQVSEEAHGLLIAYIDAENNLQSQFFAYDDDGINEFLNGASGNPTAVAFNMTTSLSSSVLNKLEDLTKCDIGAISGSKSWVVISDGTSCESSSGESKSTIDSFFETNSGMSGQVALNLLANNDYKLFLNDESFSPDFQYYVPEKTQLTYVDQQADVLIISASQFKEAAEELADYRREQLNLTVKVITVEEIYKEFNFGKRSPYPIKDFLTYVFEKWRDPDPAFVILMGDANIDHTGRLPGTLDNDYIPSYGMPFSDAWYCMIYDENEYEFSIGRIPVNTIEEANGYVEKLKAYDKAPSNSWMKRFLMLSGGQEEYEYDYFKNTLSGLSFNVGRYPLSADTISIFKEVGSKEDEVANEIINQINRGAMITTYLGHGAPDVFDMDGWHVEFLSNKNKYGLLTTLACNTGHFALPDRFYGRNETYMLAPDRGFVGSFGSSWGSKVEPSTLLVTHIFNAIRDTSLRIRTLGSLIAYGKNNIPNNYSDSYKATKELFHLLGDPLVRLRIADMTDYYLTKENVALKSESGSVDFTETDEKVIISAEIFNLGYSILDSVELSIKREYSGETETIFRKLPRIGFSENFTAELNILNMPGIHKLTITVDPNNLVAESDKSNNTFSTSFEVYKEGVLPVEPQAFFDIPAKNPVIRVINPQAKEKYDYSYYFRITEMAEGSKEIVVESQESYISVEENYIEWVPDVTLEDGKTYFIETKSVAELTGNESDFLILPVTANSAYQKNSAAQSIDKSYSIDPYISDTLLISGQQEEMDIRLASTESVFDLISFHDTETYKHYCLFKYDGKVYISAERRNGFFILDIPADMTKPLGTFRHFDTFGDMWGNPEWWEESAPEGLVRLLRDTIPENSYVLTATSGSSWRLPLAIKHDAPEEYRTKLGAIDTLKAAFREYGSVLIDSIDGEGETFWHGGWPSEFQFLGMKGKNSGSVQENFTNNGLDTIKMSGTITRYAPEGVFRTPVFGKAVEWNNIRLSGNFETEHSDIVVTVFGITQNSEPVVINEIKNSPDIDLNGIDSDIYPEIFLEIKIVRNSFSQEFLTDANQAYISGIECNFTPAPEIAVVKSKTAINSSSILRGDEFSLDFTIENISPRTDLVGGTVEIKISENLAVDTLLTIPEIPAGESKEVNLSGVTDFFDVNTTALIQIPESKEGNDIYLFNNSDEISFYIEKDDVPPVIELLVDGREVEEADFVSLSPDIQINVRDNSPLAVTDSTYIHLFVNGYHLPVESTKKYEFISNPRGSEIKYTVNAVPQDLYYGNNTSLGANSIKVIASDASGNTDTVFVRVNVAQSASMSQARTTPNPVEEDLAHISFDFISQDKESDVTISIFDNLGKRVDMIPAIVGNGENEVLWRCRNSSGNQVAPGVYYFTVETTGDTWAEPVSGKFIILR